jgi:hypothetical protein
MGAGSPHREQAGNHRHLMATGIAVDTFYEKFKNSKNSNSLSGADFGNESVGEPPSS